MPKKTTRQPATKAGAPYDAVIIGGGFYGCMLALHLSKRFPRIVLVEQADDILRGASYFNSCRVHHGYHYPRHFRTGERCASNYHRFMEDFPTCVRHEYQSIYAIARSNSKVSTRKFENFCDAIGIPLKEAPADKAALFDSTAIESVFAVEEPVYDAIALRQELWRRLRETSVHIRCSTSVDTVKQKKENLSVTVIHEEKKEELESVHVFNCTYASINGILHRSDMPILQLKHELAEMALLEPPPALRDTAITVMDGSFFALLPFPTIPGWHSLTHVTHTPHREWIDRPGNYHDDSFRYRHGRRSNITHMLSSAQQYIPLLKDILYRGSIFETKTMLPSNEVDDGRPILLKRDYHLKNFHIVMGSKIDNAYDVIDYVDDAWMKSEKNGTHRLNIAESLSHEEMAAMRAQR